jgi:hypothetical protein
MRYCRTVKINIVDQIPTKVVLEIDSDKLLKFEKYKWPNPFVVVNDIPNVKLKTGYDDHEQYVICDRYSNDIVVYKLESDTSRRRL